MNIGLQFLPTPPDSSLLYEGTSSPTWVVISVLIAILSCYAALRASNRVAQLRTALSRLSWGLISGLTMGIGIWAMHFIGMLALSLPCRVDYDPLITLISIIPGVLAGSVAMGVGWNSALRLRPLLCGVLIGAGIATMHYTGMAAMRLEGFVRYDPVLFAVSILASIGLAYVAMRVKGSEIRLAGYLRDALIAVILGLAVSSMHYTAMSSAYFVRGDVATLPATLFTTDAMAFVIAVTTAVLAFCALALAGISRNREVTDQLRESEAGIRRLLAENETILDNAPVGIAYVRQRQVVSCNRRFEEIFQYGLGELKGQSTSLLYESVQVYDQVGESAYPISASSAGYSGELKLRRKDGSWFVGTVSGKAIDPVNPHEGSIWIYTDITQRKRSEEDLRESEFRWRFAIEGSGDGLWDWDVRTNHVFHSHQWKEILGFGNDDVDKSPTAWSSRLHPQDKDRVMAQVQTQLDAQTSAYAHEYRVICKDGSVKWVLGRGLVVNRDEAGKPLRMIGTIKDITERKKVEAALLSSNARLQLLETCVSRLNDIVLITEAEPFGQPGPRIVFVNDAFVRRTGFSREEVIGKTPRILQGKNTQRSELDRVNTALKRWEPVRAELINYTKAGEEFWLELDIVPVADATGWYTHWVAVERDITERKLAEVTLLESEKRHRSMFENNPQPMWVYDSETLAFLSVNDAAVAQYGYSRQELHQMTLRDIRPAEDLPRFELQVLSDSQSRSTSAQVWTHIRKDSTKIQVEISAHAIQYEGRPARLILAHDVTERLQSEAKVYHLAFHDALTGLPNRVQFLNVANEILRGVGTSSQLSAVVLLDLDDFKSINDHWGHRCGDELLKLVAQRIQAWLPPTCFFARLGGDEFVVIVKNVGLEEPAASILVQDLCKEILRLLAKEFCIDQREHFTSASFGIALFGRCDMTVDELLSRADSAMYSAKAAGRNTYRFFDHQLQAKLAEQSKLEGELRLSIQNDELHLVFQPQFDQLGNVLGAEALLRWNHPKRGMVSPAHFIPVAESSGFILQIGHWVLHAACIALADWRSSSVTSGLTLAVNVSAKQFHHPDFVSLVLTELEASGANPALLKLELTESLLAQDLDGIVKKMSVLKSRGVTFSLDDFGTGYSSLAYLKKLPLDQLKIDQGFVRDVLVDASDAAIVRTVIALADKLGLNVIAEGVETEAQREFLESNGCNAYQGYLFSRPLKKDAFEAFCVARNGRVIVENAA